MTEERPPPRPRSADGRFEPLPDGLGPSTLAVHAARRPERNAGSVAPPIYQTSTFRYPAQFSEAGPEGDLYLYSRHENPSQQVVQEIVRRLEGAEAARVFSSGMGAISSVLLTFLSAGDEVVALESLYGGTLDLLTDLLPRHGILVRLVSDTAARDPRSQVGSATRVVLLESPTNPTLHVHDLAAWAKAADEVGALSVVDNTAATPVNQRPLAHGIDLVVHSATKYLGGHSDLVAGVVAGPARLLERMDRTRIVLGATLDPLAAFLLQRGLRTLPLRVARQNENAARVAAFLRGEPTVAQVLTPGSQDDVEESIAGRQMTGRGGLLGFRLSGGETAAEAFLRRLRLVQVAPSFGGVESLISRPSETSHVHLSDAERSARGIGPGFLRLSVGIEEPQDLIADIRQALSVAPPSAAPPL